VFLEASKYEERENQIAHALDICEEGIEYNLKYNPLWFQYLRLYEKADEKLKAEKFDKFNMIVKDLFHHVSKEFHWKVNIELAQTYDRMGIETKTQEHLRNSILECPDSIKWKVWLVASRIMQNQGMVDEARLCIERACLEVPPKQVSHTLLEYAKYFETIGETDRALEIMIQTKNKFKCEWKI
jgi:tetratricopeptide (TPR) repeat protein